MPDVDDLVEAAFDVEDIVEEVADPEDLIEDFVDDPLTVLFALTAALAGLALLFLVFLALVLVALAFGPVELLVVLAALTFAVFVGSVGAFLYVRTDVPADVYHRIDDALERADDSPGDAGPMTEREAVEELKDQYAAGNLDDYELDRALDDALTSDDPEAVVERYAGRDREKELDR